MNTDETRDPNDLLQPPEPPELADAAPQPEADLADPIAEMAEAPDETVSAVSGEADAAPAVEDPTDAMVDEVTSDAPPIEPPADESVPDVALSEDAAQFEPEHAVAAETAEGDAESFSEYGLSQAMLDAGIDVDTALSALSFELASTPAEEAPAGAPRLPPYAPPTYRPRLSMPKPISLRRGHIGSVIPAFVLIGLGIWLTFANATGAAVDPLVVGLVLAGGLVVSFAAVWLVSGRWARGLLLITLLALFGGGGAALIVNAGIANALVAYPLLLSALGLAIVLAGLLARPVERVMLGPGIVFLAAGIVGFLVLNGAVPAGILSAAAAYWFVPAAIVVLLLLLPLIFRRPA